MQESQQVKQLERSTYHLLKRAAQTASDLYADKVGRDGLTQRQFAVLVALKIHEGASQTALVKITGIDRSTMADLVARLISHGYLLRKRDKLDGRRNVLKLTAEGRRTLQRAEPGVASVDRKIASLIPKEHRKSFRAALKTLSDLQNG